MSTYQLKRLAVTILLAVTANFCSFAWAAGGGPGDADGGTSSTGGGNIIQLENGAPLLIDFAVHGDLGVPKAPDRHAQLPRTSFYEVANFERVVYPEMPARKLVEQRLDLWQKASVNSVLVAAIHDTLLKMHFFYVFDDFVTLPNYVLTPDLEKYRASVSTVILYDDEIGSVISAHFWNLADEKTQAGLIVHEALRHLQKGHGYPVADGELQDVTAFVFLHDPKAGENLDDLILAEMTPNSQFATLLHALRDYSQKYLDDLKDLHTQWTTLVPALTQEVGQSQSCERNMKMMGQFLNQNLQPILKTFLGKTDKKNPSAQESGPEILTSITRQLDAQPVSQTAQSQDSASYFNGISLELTQLEICLMGSPHSNELHDMISLAKQAQMDYTAYGFNASSSKVIDFLQMPTDDEINVRLGLRFKSAQSMKRSLTPDQAKTLQEIRQKIAAHIKQN